MGNLADCSAGMSCDPIEDLMNDGLVDSERIDLFLFLVLARRLYSDSLPVLSLYLVPSLCHLHFLYPLSLHLDLLPFYRPLGLLARH